MTPATPPVPNTGEQTCSRAGCRDAAVWVIAWRNPRIHGPERRKEWIACDAHVGYLRDFLATRDFPLEVAPLTTPTAAALPGGRS